MPDHDVAIVGGGCVGCATAYHLADTALDVCVVEKEAAVATHQSGRNSGVLHPGFNYEPGSLKAEFSTVGTRQAKAFARTHDIPCVECGVVVVAQDRSDERRLKTLHEQATANGVTTTIVGEDRLAELEPHARGQAALHCPAAASIDAREYVTTLAREAMADGVTFRFEETVRDITETEHGAALETDAGTIRVDYLVNAAGLHADRLAHAVGIGERYQVVPFRGEYRELVPGRRELCRSMIYPTPDPDLPFLGVHFTRRADGRVIVGPNAVLAGGREAYNRWSVDGGDLLETLGYPGFWRLMADPQMLAIGLSELQKTYRPAKFLAAARELLPDLSAQDLIDSYAGIRAQVVSQDGTLVGDPIVLDGQSSTHVLNAVSPGLTASLPFGEQLATTVTNRL